MDDLSEVPYPWLLVGVIGGVLVLALLAGGISSPASLSPYNHQWDGTSDLRETVTSGEQNPDIGLSVEAYDDLDRTDSVSIILSPERTFDAEATSTIRNYVESGGTLVVAGDFQPAVNSLLTDLGSDMRIRGVPVRDERNNFRGPALPRATLVNETNYTRNVSGLTLNHGTVLRVSPDVTVAVQTSEFAYLDSNDDQTLSPDETLDHHPVMAIQTLGEGKLIAISDSSIFINSMLGQSGNHALVSNLQEMHSQVLLDYSHTGEIPPINQLVILLRSSELLQVAFGLAGLAVILILPWHYSTVSKVKTTDGPDMEKEEVISMVQQRYPQWDRERIRRMVGSWLE